MTDTKILAEKMTPENFKDLILEMERENLRNLDKEEKKVMVSRIIRVYEESKKNGNS